jgi:hypothetical protein
MSLQHIIHMTQFTELERSKRTTIQSMLGIRPTQLFQLLFLLKQGASLWRRPISLLGRGRLLQPRYDRRPYAEPGGPRRRREHSTRHTPFRRRPVCSSCSPRAGHGGQVVVARGHGEASYTIIRTTGTGADRSSVNVVWLGRGVGPDP